LGKFGTGSEITYVAAIVFRNLATAKETNLLGQHFLSRMKQLLSLMT